jgi:hypothetical protein
MALDFNPIGGDVSIQRTKTVRVPVWIERPYELLSWWDMMLPFSSRQFFWTSYALQHIVTDCYIGSVAVGDDDPAFLITKPLDDDARRNAIKGLEPTQKFFAELGFHISADTIGELIDLLKKPNPMQNIQWLLDEVRSTRKLCERELKHKAFFYVPPESSVYFPNLDNLHVFGEEVNEAFPGAAFDISESGTCLALGRASASVFHLMRVLEIGLAALGRVFGVSLEHTNWGPAIDQIESKIKRMHETEPWKSQPDRKKQQEFYAQAASHFGILKDAWRNYTMHARGFYTEEQARRIFQNTKSFMQNLSEGGLHE